MTLIVDSATSGPWESLGEVIRRAGQEDASGSRRMYARWLGSKDFAKIETALGITRAEAEALREEFVTAFGEPG